MVTNHRGGSESSVVVATLLFLTTSTSAVCRRRFADVPAGSDVADFRCPTCTSAEPYFALCMMSSKCSQLLINGFMLGALSSICEWSEHLCKSQVTKPQVPSLLGQVSSQVWSHYKQVASISQVPKIAIQVTTRVPISATPCPKHKSYCGHQWPIGETVNCIQKDYGLMEVQKLYRFPPSLWWQWWGSD